jgi:hypothetical protein
MELKRFHKRAARTHQALKKPGCVIDLWLMLTRTACSSNQRVEKVYTTLTIGARKRGQAQCMKRIIFTGLYA